MAKGWKIPQNGNCWLATTTSKHRTNHTSQRQQGRSLSHPFSVSERERERQKDIKTAVHNEQEEESKQLTRFWRRQEVWSIVGFINDIDFCTRWKRCGCEIVWRSHRKFYDLSLVLSRFGDAAGGGREKLSRKGRWFYDVIDVVGMRFRRR